MPWEKTISRMRHHPLIRCNSSAYTKRAKKRSKASTHTWLKDTYFLACQGSGVFLSSPGVGNVLNLSPDRREYENGPKAIQSSGGKKICVRSRQTRKGYRLAKDKTKSMVPVCELEAKDAAEESPPGLKSRRRRKGGLGA